MKCDKCGKEFEPGNTNGLPNGIGFELSNGTTITVCSDCVKSFTTDEGQKWLEQFK